MFQEIFITEITTSELLVCRGCLATDIRLHDMRQNRLTEAYSTLLSTATPITDDLPHYLCSFCAALLLKCDGFRAKCISAQIILKNAILPSLEQTLENIKRIDRPTYFRQSYIQTIDIDVSNQKSNDNADQLLETVKSELENDIHNINDHFTDISADDNTDSVNDDSFILKNALSSNTRSLRKRKVENTATKRAKIKDLSNFKTDDIKNDEIHTKPTNNEVFRNSSEINKANSDTDDEITIADLKLNTKAKLNERTKEKNNIKETKQKIHKANPAGNKKTENVSKMYNMDEVNLSKEEQLKEVADRKNSENYLEAVHKCEICYKGFRFKESFNSHMLLHDDRSGKFICDVCSCHFQSIHRLRKHRATHKKKFTCKHAGCTYVTKHLSQAKEHYKWHGGVKDTCKHCGKECSGQTSYYHHLKLYHPTSDDLVRCEICGASCSGLLGFKMHEKRTHKEMFSPECHCSGCDTQFYCSSALKAHQGAAGLCDPRAKFCVRCGRSFDTEQLLREHEAEERKPRTSFKCEVCNKNFEGYTSLKKHQLRHAMTLHQRLVCEICGKVLSNQHILKQHYLNKHSTENPFKCPECPKSFRSIINLKYHSLIHTGEKPHPCPHCPNTFRSITNLRRHQLVHTDARPHSCEICAKAFKTKADCKAHVQAVHMKIYRPRVRRKYKKNE